MELNENIILPDKNEKLAELFGILTGDGYINYYPKRQAYVVEVCGNSIKDGNYLKGHFSKLTLQLFNFNLKFYYHKSQNVIRARILSKDIFNHINSLGFPAGFKGEIITPEWILEDEKLFKQYIKGLFDTDGHLCLKNKEGKKYPVIGITSKSKSLLEPIRNFLLSKGISSYLGTHNSKTKNKDSFSIVNRIQISGKKNIKLFFDLIGSNNNRNLNKYEELLKL